jgi:hypothetical protein
MSGVAFADRGPVEPKGPNPPLCEFAGLPFEPMTRECIEVHPNPNSDRKEAHR